MGKSHAAPWVIRFRFSRYQPAPIPAMKYAVVGWLRTALPYFERVSALLMVVAGTYIIYYWLFKGGLINTFV